jgi:hypothetical protein
VKLEKCIKNIYTMEMAKEVKRNKNADRNFYF